MLLSDVAVMVHPDERYVHPESSGGPPCHFLCDHTIPVVADDYVDKIRHRRGQGHARAARQRLLGCSAPVPVFAVVTLDAINVLTRNTAAWTASSPWAVVADLYQGFLVRTTKLMVPRCTRTS
jgi:hypothetical protein